MGMKIMDYLYEEELEKVTTENSLNGKGKIICYSYAKYNIF